MQTMNKKKAQAQSNKPKIVALVNTKHKIQQGQAPNAIAGHYNTRPFTINKGKKQGDIVISGSEFLTNVTIPASSAAGQTIFNLGMSPINLPNTRLSNFAALYEKYRFKKITFEYQAGSSSLTNGSIIVAFDNDPNDATPPANGDGVRQFESWATHCNAKCWENAKCTVDFSADPGPALFTQPAYTNTGDVRLYEQGQVYVAMLLAPTGGPYPIGTLHMHYELELFVPQLEATSLYLNASANSVTTSNAASAGFNTAVPSAQSTIKLITDPQSNKYLVVPPGTWELIQNLFNVGAAQAWNTPQAVGGNAQNGLTISNVFNQVAAGAAGAATRVDWIQNTTGGPISLYNSVTASTTSAFIELLLIQARQSQFPA